jgi:arginase family enzyme
MVTKNDAFPSRYLKAEDLKGPTVVEIETVVPELLKGSDGSSKTKQVAYFKSKKKVLVLNVVNFDAITDITAQIDTDDWPGHCIELFTTTTTMGGKSVACIRVRAPGQKSAKTPAPKAEEQQSGGSTMDDGIPFAPCR